MQIPQGYSVNLNTALIDRDAKTATVCQQYYTDVSQLTDPNNPSIVDLGKVVPLTQQQLDSIASILIAAQQ